MIEKSRNFAAEEKSVKREDKKTWARKFNKKAIDSGNRKERESRRKLEWNALGVLPRSRNAAAC